MDPLITQNVAHLRRINRRLATIEHRTGILLRLAAFLGKALADAAPADLLRWQDALTGRISAASISTYVAHVQGFYRWAYEYELIERNPAIHLVRPARRRTLPRPVPEDHVGVAVRTATGQLRAMLILAAYVGLRASEIAQVRREDVIRETTGTFLLVHGKGGKERIVPLVGDVWAELAPRLVGGRGVVFWRPSGIPANGKFVTNLISAHLQGLGLPYTAHQLRHRFGTRLYAVTRDLRLVQEVMGHASADQTAGYVQLAQDRQAAGMHQVAQELAGQRRRTSGKRPLLDDGSAASAA